MKKKLVAIIAVTVLISVILIGCSIKTPDKYYDKKSSKQETTSSVLKNATITIKCDTILKNKDKLDENLIDIIPKNGIVLDTTSVKADNTDTAYSILIKIAKENSIILNTIGSGDSTYIAGINAIKEFSCGELSGWKYSVNGEFLGVSCGAYKIKDGDKIEFLYTCDLGKDLE